MNVGIVNRKVGDHLSWEHQRFSTKSTLFPHYQFSDSLWASAFLQGEYTGLIPSTTLKFLPTSGQEQKQLQLLLGTALQVQRFVSHKDNLPGITWGDNEGCGVAPFLQKWGWGHVLVGTCM